MSKNFIGFQEKKKIDVWIQRCNDINEIGSVLGDIYENSVPLPVKTPQGMSLIGS